MTNIKAIIYIASTPVLLNPKSATPQIKKTNARNEATIPVPAKHLGCLLLKQQNSGEIPIFYIFIL